VEKVTIGLAENRQQWEALVSYRNESCADLLIIPVNPEVNYLAQIEGKPGANIEDFCSVEELNHAGDANIQRVEALAEDFDRILSQLATGASRHEWVSLSNFFHPLKGFFDSISLRMLPVIKAFRELKPQAAVCFEQPQHWSYGLNLMDKPAMSLTSRLLPLVAQAFGCQIIWLAEPTPELRDPSLHQALREETLTGSAVNSRNLALLKQVLRDFVTNPRMLLNRVQGWAEAQRPVWSPVLIQSTSSDLNPILECWSKPSPDLIFSYGEIFQEDEVGRRKTQYSSKIGSALWSMIQEDLGFRRHLITENIDWFPLIAPLLRTIALNGIPDLLAFAPVAAKAMARFRRAVILTGGMVGRNSIVAKAGQTHGIPTVSIHYGGYIGYCLLPMHERYDLAEADYFICGGFGAAKTLATPAPTSFWRLQTKRAKPVPLGNPRIDELVNQNRLSRDTGRKKTPAERPVGFQTGDNQAPVVMYVTSALVGDNRYLGYVFYPEIWYYQFQRRVIEYFAKFSKIRFLLKPPLKNRYPQIHNPLFDWLNREGPNNVEVMEDIPFSQVLHRADAFILDVPATPLLEILVTGKPTLLFADRRYLKVVPRAAELLRQGGIALTESEDEFFQGLDNFLSQGVTSAPPLNEDFLKMYVTHLHDGRSSERLAAFLHLLARGGCFDESTSNEA
jgi:hypothetical protein